MSLTVFDENQHPINRTLLAFFSKAVLRVTYNLDDC